MRISFHPPTEIGVFAGVNNFSYAHCFLFSYKEWNSDIIPKVFHMLHLFYPAAENEVCDEGEYLHISIAVVLA